VFVSTVKAVLLRQFFKNKIKNKSIFREFSKIPRAMKNPSHYFFTNFMQIMHC